MVQMSNTTIRSVFANVKGAKTLDVYNEIYQLHKPECHLEKKSKQS